LAGPAPEGRSTGAARSGDGLFASLLSPVTLARLKLAALFLGLGALVVAGALAALVRSRDLSQIPARVVEAVLAETGGHLRFGKAEIRYWPQPRIVFDRLSFEHADAGLWLNSGRAVLRIGLTDLLDGSIDQPHLELSAPDIRFSAAPFQQAAASPSGLIALLDKLSASFAGTRLAAARLTLTQARVSMAEAGLGPSNLLLEPVDARLRYRAGSGRLDITARRNSTLRPLEFSASLPTARALDNRQARAASFRISGFGSRGTFEGTMARQADLALNGRIDISIHDDLARLVGLSLSRPPRTSDEQTRLAGSFMLDTRGGGLEGLTISRGDGSLSGIASLRENAGRWGVSATLAGDLVDGTAAHAALQRLRAPEGSWSRAELDVNPASRIDLDLRLSTKVFKLGRVALENAALSVFTRKGRAEFSIADSRYAGGTLKARVTVMERPGGQDLRFQISGDRIESETLLEQAFDLSRLRGISNFVLQGDSSGRTISELAANLNGSGGVEIRAGTIIGIDANRLMARIAESRPEAALLASLGGRTPFETISTHVTIRNGRIEPVGSTLTAPRMIGLLEGAIDLSAQRHDLAIVLRRREDQPPLPNDFFAFRIEGALFAPQLRPDLSLLARRS
jgi:AsmA protein